MTVKELIERLKLAPEHANVCRDDSHIGDTPIDKIEIILGEDCELVIIY